MDKDDLLGRLRDNPVEPDNPIIGDTGVTVKVLVRATQTDDGVEALMAKHPGLEPEDVMAALLYAGGLRD